ncbi:prepilin peptidase [Rhodococcus spelaei]|uniref:Prepilin peptidase n=1 Tax=Rhodococcus spelaei TaxID=2546320 RepID=A0A541B241_9NOCA|nr:prepilin peptidase [Rhodococcus spelaei]TQF66393.1 prepilin peptidase [Rhodococcus spelaei]
MVTVLAAVVGVLVGLATRPLLRRFLTDPPLWCVGATAVGFAVAVVVADGPLVVAAVCALLWWCVCLTAVDVRVRRLPNALTLPGAAAVLVVGALAGRGTSALVGAALLAGLYLAVHLLAPAAMGAGDVKLALGLGAAAGIAGGRAWLLAAVGAVALTAVVGVAVLAAGRRGVSLPHGPSMCAATVLAMVAAGGA